MARIKRLTAQLPPTPCTPEMRENLVEVADYRGVSIAELTREAISLFLAQNDRNSIIKDGITFKAEES